MLTIAEYAKSRSVSYEAVRKQINRYSIELDGHISRQGRTQYLDSEAEAFLDSRRQKDPVFVLDDRDRVLQEKEQRIAELEDLLQKMTLKYQAEHAVAMIAEERQAMITDQKEQIQSLIADRRKVEEEKDAAVRQAHDLELDLLKAQKERELEEEKNRHLEDAQKDTQKRMEEKDEYILKLKNRGFISRLLNKDI